MRQYWRYVIRIWIFERTRIEVVPKVLRANAMVKYNMLEGVLLILEMKTRMAT